MNTFKERLRAERERLGLTQLSVCDLAGVSKNTQVNYESGKRSPDAEYLMQLGSVGFDLQFLLTGIRLEAGSIADTAREIRERFGRGFTQPAAEATHHPVPWHEVFQMAEAAPVALASDWIAAQGLSAATLRATPIERAVMQIEMPGTMIAVVDTAAPREGGPSPWAAIIDGKTMLAEIEFHARSMVMPRLMTNGKSVTLWDDERQAVEVLGRLVWLGIGAEGSP